MSSVFDDISAIAKAQADAYHVAYQTGVDSCQPRIKFLEGRIRELEAESFALEAGLYALGYTKAAP